MIFIIGIASISIEYIGIILTHNTIVILIDFNSHNNNN